MKRLLTLALLFLGLFSPVFAELAELGINPLRLEAGARPLGMGGAFVGLADDVYAVFYNPAGQAWTKGISITAKDIENIAALEAYPTGNNSSLGLAIVNYKLKNIPVPGSTNEANYSGDTIQVSYGTKLNFLPFLFQQDIFQRIGVGLSVKGLFGQTLRQTGRRDMTGSGWDMDLGLLYKGTDWWSLGACAQNILPAKALGGGEMKWDSGGTEGLPYSLNVGGAAKVIGDLTSPIFMEGRELNLVGEFNYAANSPLLIKFGGEWAMNKTYFFRAGVMQQWKPSGTVSNLNLGLGYRQESWGFDVSSYRDPLSEEGCLFFTFLYFPKDWVVQKKLDVEKPSIKLEGAIERISLEDNIVTKNDRLEIVGKVKPGVGVYVNGMLASTAADNTFKVTIPLQLGKNLVIVEARCEGEKKSWKYKVLREASIDIAEEKQVQVDLERAQTEAEKEELKKKEKEINQRKQKVEELVTMGVIEVSPEAEFQLNASITRGELSTWLAKSMGLPLPKISRAPFPDVREDNPQAPFIKAIVDWGLLQPYPDGTFHPDEPVTKEEGDKLFNLLKKAQR